MRTRIVLIVQQCHTLTDRDRRILAISTYSYPSKRGASDGQPPFPVWIHCVTVTPRPGSVTAVEPISSESEPQNPARCKGLCAGSIALLCIPHHYRVGNDKKSSTSWSFCGCACFFLFFFLLRFCGGHLCFARRDSSERIREPNCEAPPRFGTISGGGLRPLLAPWAEHLFDCRANADHD